MALQVLLIKPEHGRRYWEDMIHKIDAHTHDEYTNNPKENDIESM